MTKYPAFHSKATHTDIDFHFIHDIVTKKVITLKYCNPNEQLANVCAKALSKEKFIELISLLRICNFESKESIED